MLHAFAEYPRTTRPTRGQDARDRQVDGFIRAPRFPRRASRPYLPRPLLRRGTAVEPARRDVPLGGHRRRHHLPLEARRGRGGFHPAFDQGERAHFRQGRPPLRGGLGFALGVAGGARLGRDLGPPAAPGGRRQKRTREAGGGGAGGALYPPPPPGPTAAAELPAAAPIPP